MFNLSVILTCARAAYVTVVLEKQLQAVFESFCRHSKWMPDDVLQPSAPRRNKALKGMSVSGFVELSHQAGVQRVTFIKKVFESHCNQVSQQTAPADAAPLAT